jgi:ABC-type antimicrobial peptide transport system permease subunit
VVVDLRESMVGGIRTLLLVLTGAVVWVLLIASVNLASLLMARAAGRSQEVLIRASLGAGRARLVRQWLTESATLGLVGGALGLAAAHAGLPFLLRWLPPDLLPRMDEIRLNGPVLVFTLAVPSAPGSSSASLRPCCASAGE